MLLLLASLGAADGACDPTDLDFFANSSLWAKNGFRWNDYQDGSASGATIFALSQSDFQSQMPTMTEISDAEGDEGVDFCNDAACTTSNTDYCGRPSVTSGWKGSYVKLAGYGIGNAGNKLCLNPNDVSDGISAGERGAKACSFFCSHFPTCKAWMHYPGVGERRCLMFTAATDDLWVATETGSGGSSYSWAGC